MLNPFLFMLAVSSRTTDKILSVFVPDSSNTKKDGDFVNISIQDSGMGIPQDIQDKIFDPFFTTKEIGKGTGMGLEFVHQIIKNQHNGSIYLDSKPGETIFTICIPIKA